MARVRYPIEVEEILCRFYLEYPNEWREKIEKLMTRLRNAGYGDYEIDNIIAKMKDYQKIATGGNISHCAPKSVKTYKKLTSSHLEGIDSYLKDNYGYDSPILDYKTEVTLPPYNGPTINIDLTSNNSDLGNFVVPNMPNKPIKSLSKYHHFLELFFEVLNKSGKSGKDIYGPHEVYFRRKHFNKVLRGESISKETVLQLAILLEVDIDTTLRLLSLAGFGVNKGIRRDLIIVYAIENGIYDPFEIDSTLIDYGEEELFNKED